jgi:hypothetical protein
VDAIIYYFNEQEFVMEQLSLRPDELRLMAEKNVTCPFVGTAVATSHLPVFNEVTNPLARIEDVRSLGNSGDSGNSDLGDVLAFFASGNHALMRGPDDRLGPKVPDGLFSLEFPGSQGSHPGHSGILQDDPEMLDSGVLNLENFQRLARRASDGVLKRTDVAKFIAENLHRDPHSKVFHASVVALLGQDLGHVVATAGASLLEMLRGSQETSSGRRVEEKLTKLMGEDNLIGSSGEFGLLFAFLANRPGAKEVEGEPVLFLEDVRKMFVDKTFPDGWETWRKTRADWIKNTTALIVSSAKAYLALSDEQAAGRSAI